ncbi:MAG: hypothetical protein ABJG47_12125 [Ekhidna sp.]
MNKFLRTFLLLLITEGCDFGSIELDKVKGPSIDNAFAINLGNIKYTVGELIDDLEDESLEVTEGSDFSMSFIFRDTSFFDDVDSFVEVGEITNTDSFSPFDVDIPAIGTEATVTIPTKNFEFEFNPENGERLDSTFFSGGTLTYTLSSDFDIEIDYILTLKDVKNSDNEPLIFDRTLPAISSSDSQSRSLAGLKNVSRRIGSSNIFEVALDMTLHIPAGKTINASDEVAIELAFIDSQFSALFGDFGSDPVEVQKDSILISAFDEFSENGLALNNPSITMDFVNTFGVELGVSLDEITSFNADNSELTLAGSVVDNNQFVDAPNNTQLGQGVKSSFSIDKSNSNIDELLNTTPNKMVFDLTAIPNPPASDNINNYLTDSSYVEIVTTVEIPLDLKMDGFSKEFELSVSGSDLNDADSLKINIEVINEIPFNGLLNLSFIDDDGNALYTLAEIALITSPEIGIDGRSTEPTITLSSVALDEEGIDAFLNSTEVIASMSIFTLGHQDGDFVKIYSDYLLEIHLTAEGKASIDL